MDVIPNIGVFLVEPRSELEFWPYRETGLHIWSGYRNF